LSLSFLIRAYLREPRAKGNAVINPRKFQRNAIRRRRDTAKTPHFIGEIICIQSAFHLVSSGFYLVFICVLFAFGLLLVCVVFANGLQNCLRRRAIFWRWSTFYELHASAWADASPSGQS
jgi:hypothetical protein